MKLKEFIKTDPHVNLTDLASRMYPTNIKGAKNALSAKLNGTRAWNEKDAELAKSALREIFTERINIIDSLD